MDKYCPSTARQGIAQQCPERGCPNGESTHLSKQAADHAGPAPLRVLVYESALFRFWSFFDQLAYSHGVMTARLECGRWWLKSARPFAISPSPDAQLFSISRRSSFLFFDLPKYFRFGKTALSQLFASSEIEKTLHQSEGILGGQVHKLLRKLIVNIFNSGLCDENKFIIL